MKYVPQNNQENEINPYFNEVFKLVKKAQRRQKKVNQTQALAY